MNKIKVNDVVFREDLYPRAQIDPATAQKYAEVTDLTPPIEINQNNELIDGRHRLTAHKKKELEFIDCFVTETKSDLDLLELSIERNNAHGYQLSSQDKKKDARTIYKLTPIEEQAEKKKSLAELLSVTPQTVNNWLKDIDQDNKDERNNLIINLWLSCHTEQEIADAVGVSKMKISRVCNSFKNFEICYKSGNFDNIEDLDERFDAEKEYSQEMSAHEKDFEIPIYNIWRKQNKTNDVSHFGNSEQTWVDRLLYLYTKPFDVVVDPFAGGGTTIDVCAKRLRRHFVSDRKPIIEREHEIREFDVTNGLPPLPRWKDVKLVYLDPPYWKQAEGQYSDDDADLANMTLDTFNAHLSGLIKEFGKKLKGGEPSYIALIIQPTQWKSEGRIIADHIADMIKFVKLPLDARYSVPYSTEQYTPQMVNWAKENRKCLVLTREIIVWRVV